MQSIIQYRRARQAAQAQLDRDKEKAGTRAFNASHLANGNGSAGTGAQHEKSSDDANGDANGVQSDTDLERNLSTTSQNQNGSALAPVLTGINVRDRTAHEGSGGQVFVVGWAGPDDPHKPHNWSLTKRVGVTLQIALIGLFLTAASAIDATVLPQAAKDLGVSEVAESLATGLYLLGMGLGSLIAGPFSETFGRNAVYSVSLVIFMLWIMAAGLAPNFGAQIVFRFLAGCSASTPLVCSGGSIADMFNSIEKTWSFPLYAILSFTGPMLGPVMGAYIGPSTLVSWRWTEWTMLIAAGLVLTIVLLLMPETYGPLLLQWKAAHYRAITGDDRFRCEHEITDATLLSRLKVSMTRPFLMFTEPIILAMCLYITVVYIVLFTFLVGWPDIFEHTYGIGQGLSNLIFLAMAAGTQFNFLLVPIIYRMTVKRTKAAEDARFKPEVRLWFGTFGAAIAIPVSLFWLGWTDFASISIWSPILAVALFGYGVAGIFLCVYMYVIDSYEIYSASALTFVALVRYVIAGGMTVAGIPFYKNMGTHYTLTILACISVALVPIPYLLYYYGHILRSRSRFAVL